MECSFYKNICSIGGSFCQAQGEEAEKNCPEAAKFRRIEKSLCPIMVAYGYDDRLCKCDLPLWLRVLIPHCLIENQCIIAVYFPKIKGQVCDHNLKPEEIARLKTEIRKNVPRRSAPATA